MRSLEEASKEIYDGVFKDRGTVEVEGKRYKVRKALNFGLRFVEVDGFTFLEQNPEKNSVWGRLAREGHKILWVIEVVTTLRRYAMASSTILIGEEFVFDISNLG